MVNTRHRVLQRIKGLLTLRNFCGTTCANFGEFLTTETCTEQLWWNVCGQFIGWATVSYLTPGSFVPDWLNLYLAIEWRRIGDCHHNLQIVIEHWVLAICQLVPDLNDATRRDATSPTTNQRQVAVWRESCATHIHRSVDRSTDRLRAYGRHGLTFDLCTERSRKRHRRAYLTVRGTGGGIQKNCRDDALKRIASSTVFLFAYNTPSNLKNKMRRFSNILDSSQTLIVDTLHAAISVCKFGIILRPQLRGVEINILYFLEDFTTV